MVLSLLWFGWEYLIFSFNDEKMANAFIKGMGFYVPEQVVTNQDLEKVMDTSDEWIQERTGIKERRYSERHKETTSTLAHKAALNAINDAGIDKEEIDFIIFATLSPDYFFPGCGVLLQRHLGLQYKEIGALDVRTQCTGFIYALTVADSFIKAGMYKNILVVGAEVHSMGLDYTTRGRNVTVIFGDGAGAAIVSPTDNPDQGIVSTSLHAQGDFAEELAMINPGSHGGVHVEDPAVFGYEFAKYGNTFVSQHMMDEGLFYPQMNGPAVFKMAVTKMPEAVGEVLKKANKTPADIDMLVCHQANLRIAQMVQKSLGLPDDKVWNNIQKYGNTTAASIPIALTEAWYAKKIKRGDLVCLAAFGSGFTWGACLINW